MTTMDLRILKMEKPFEKGAKVLLSTTKGRAVAVGTSTANDVSISNTGKGEAVTLDTVLMEPGTYSKGWRKAPGLKDDS